MPRHIRNIIIAAILAVLALAAGTIGYVHHQFKTNIDNTLSSIRPFVQIKYSDLSTSILSGEVTLKNVRISHEALPETLTLGTILIETPGFAYMLSGPESIKKGEFPDHFGFSVDDFYLDLTGETAKWLDRLVKRMQPVYASERTLCGGKSLLGPSDYKEMGYTRLRSNMRIAYNFNEAKKTLKVDISSGTQKMGNVEGHILISNIRKMSSSGLLQGGIPQLTSVDLVYKDETYMPRLIKYCAALSGMKNEEFIDAEIKQSDEHFYMVWGFAPGLGLRDAYKDFMLKPDVVTLSMAPSKDFNPMLFAKMSGTEIMEALNTHLKINDLLVTDLSFKTAPPEFTEKFNQQLARSLDFNSLLRGEPVKAPEPVEKPKVIVKAPAQYHKIRIDQISDHVRDFVKITTKRGNERNGQLLRFDSVNLYVQKKVSGGKFIMTVPRNKIKTIEAYFSK